MCDALGIMWKKFLPVLPVLLMAGCATTVNPDITHLTPGEQPRSASNQYLLETTFDSSQKSLRWDSVRVTALVDGKTFPMTVEGQLTNRWEGYVTIPPGQNTATYRFIFDYKYNQFGGAPRPATAVSPAYTLKISD